MLVNAYALLLLLLRIIPQTNGEDETCSSYTMTESAKHVVDSMYDTRIPDIQIDIVIWERIELCEINITEIYSTFSLTSAVYLTIDRYLYVQIDFLCPVNRTKIQFETRGLNETDRQKYKLLLAFGLCTVSVESLNDISRFGKIKSLVNHAGITLSESNNCSFTDDLWELTSIVLCEPVQQCGTIFEACQGQFPNVYQLIIENEESVFLSTTFIESLKQRCPSVQFLNLINIKLESTLTFPWTTVFLNPIQNDTLQKQIHIDNGCCVYRQLHLSFSVQSNQIDKLQLVGDISIIHITGAVGMTRETLFYNVTGLIELDLSRNALEHLPRNLFKYQNKLYKLILQGNLLHTLQSGVFDSLISLKYLDLSHNRLNYLKSDIFKNVLQLKEIHLENNLLEQLSVILFDNQFKTLGAIYLHSNPLRVIPANLLYAPYLEILDLHNSSIDDVSIDKLLNQVDIPDMDIGDKIRQDDQRKSLDPVLSVNLKARKLDVSFCKIKSFPFTDDFHLSQFRDYDMAELTLKFIKIDFLGNPIYCACKITVLQNLLRRTSNTVSSQYTAETLLCLSPLEMYGRPVLSIGREEMYCPIENILCPSVCSCFSRLDSSSIIVDCRHTNVSSLPIQMPLETLELWYHNSTIREISSRDYLVNVSVLDLSHCKIHSVAADAVMQFSSMHTLHLDANLLATLPVELRHANLTLLTLSNNPFICDCHLHWMKVWLLNRRSPVKDWKFIKCNEGSKMGKELYMVEESKFVCTKRDYAEFDYVKHAVLPSAIVGSFLFLFTVLTLIVIFQNMTIKALLYVYCGIHPFDKDPKAKTHIHYDAFAVYNYGDKYFMQEKVVDYLIGKGYNVVDMYRNFVVGVSFTENVKQLIRKSQRIIICVSARTMNDELMRLAWTLSYEKVQESTSNFIILIQNDCGLKQIKDSSLARYIRHRGYVRNNSPVFSQCLEYVMPKLSQRVNGLPEDYQNEDMNDENFICYPDNIHQDVTQGVIPCLHKCGFVVRLFEFEFVPGGALGEEVIKVIERAKRVIFILSNDLLQDEVKLMILKTVIARTMTCDYNFLLLFTHGSVAEANMSSDIRHYIDTHVTASMDEADFISRLLCALAAKRRIFDDDRELQHENEVEMRDRMTVPLV